MSSLKLSYKLNRELRKALLETFLDLNYAENTPEASLHGSLLFLQRLGYEIKPGPQVSEEARTELAPLLQRTVPAKRPAPY